MTENQPSTFYGVAYGYQRGVFTTYKDVQAATKGFPQPVFKKFDTREEAENFVKKSQPVSKIFEAKETDTDNKFYAVARGHIIGIFKDYETVKNNCTGFPKPLHKKFSNFADAMQYIEKFADGKAELKTPKKRSHREIEESNEIQSVKPVARKRTSGKVDETDESEGEHLDQSIDQTQSMNETNEMDTETTVQNDQEAGSSVAETKSIVEENNKEGAEKLVEDENMDEKK